MELITYQRPHPNHPGQWIARRGWLTATGATQEQARQALLAQEWPKNEDGTPKKMGELPKELQREILRESLDRLRPFFESEQFKAAIQ